MTGMNVLQAYRCSGSVGKVVIIIVIVMKLKLLQYFYAEDEKRREPHGLQNCELINLRKPSSIKRGFSWATIRGNETVTRYSVATGVQLLLLLQHHHQHSRQLLSGVHLFDLIDLRLKLRAMYMFIHILKTEAIVMKVVKVEEMIMLLSLAGCLLLGVTGAKMFFLISI